MKVCSVCLTVVTVHESRCPTCDLSLLNVPFAFKRCPNPACGVRVLADEDVCACGADMTQVPLFKICPDCNQNQLSETEVCPHCGHIYTELAPDKICICGYVNSSTVKECAECARTILKSDLNWISSVKYILVSQKDSYCIPVSEPSVVIGRSETGWEYLKNYDYVSREHIRLTVQENNELYATDITAENETWLLRGLADMVGRRLEKDRMFHVTNGDRLSLSGAPGVGYEVILSVVKVKGKTV